MRIIIVGDGKVGYTLAERLSQENHDIVIIDKNENALRRADDALDVLCIPGSGASLHVLEEAGVDRADLFIAATSGDEMNMVCCLMARKLGARYTIARVRDPAYTDGLKLLKQELGLAMIINPEETTAKEIARILCFPQLNSIEGFGHGRLEMAGFRVLEKDPIVGHPISSFAKKLPANVLFCAMERNGHVTIPDGNTVWMPGDDAYIIGVTASLHAFFKYLGRPNTKVRNVLIAGGGRITHYLAKELLRQDMAVKIIELDERAAFALSSDLPEAMIIQGDGTDQKILQSEGLGQMDAFVALTDRDEENLMVSLYAHAQKVPKVIAKSNRINYSDLVRRIGVDSVISPKLLAADHITRYVRALSNTEGSIIETLVRIVQGQAEMLEFSACPRSGLVGKPLHQLPLKKGVLIVGLIRADKTIVPRGDTIIQPNDHVVAITHGLGLVDLDDLLE